MHMSCLAFNTGIRIPFIPMSGLNLRPSKTSSIISQVSLQGCGGRTTMGIDLLPGDLNLL